MRSKFLLLLVLLAGAAQAQYGGALGSTWNNPGSAFISHLILNDINRKALEKQLQKPAVNPPRQPQAVSDQYPLSRTDFTFRGPPTAQQNCAAIADDPGTQKQLADVCLNLFRQIEGQKDFRKHNLAAGFTLLLGASWQVAQAQEFTDGQFSAVERTLNDQLVNGAAMQKLTPREIQDFYESAVMIGGFILALNEDEDATNRELGRELAGMVLQTFGLK